MIKINLLPIRAVKKKETAKQEISIFFLCLVGTLLICGALFYQLYMKINATRNDIVKSEADLAQLKTTIGEIEKIKSLEADVQKKLDILNQLRKGKTGPVHRLSTLGDITPEKLWLTKYEEKADSVSISGVALSEDLIETFLNNMKGSEDFTEGELLVSEQLIQAGLKAKRFDINSKLKTARKMEPPQLPVKK